MNTSNQTQTPTPALSCHQQAILDFTQTNPQLSLIVDACAGAAKTTTLVAVANALASANLGSILALAFNKSIAQELAQRLPPTVHSSTINSLGHRAIATYTKAKIQVKDSKPWGLFLEHCPYFQTLDKDSQAGVIHAYARIKMAGACYPSLSKSSLPKPRPVSQQSPDTIFQLALDILGFFDLDLQELASALPHILAQDIFQSLHQGQIQFIDQIYLPAIFPQISLPSFQHVIVDEAQDLSPLDHALLTRLVSKYPAGRLIAFGDKGQAIYAFRGADYDSFSSLQSIFTAHTLPLPVSFRCPQAVVREAQTIDSRIQPWASAPEGSVSRQPFSSVSDLPPDSTILCRNNAPLIRVALAAIQNLIGVNFLGRDLEKQLLSFLSQHSKKVNSISGLWDHLTIQANQAQTKSGKARVEDFTNCLKVIANHYSCETFQEIASGIQAVFQSTGSLTLATIHKSKGLEWPTVYLIRPDLIPSPFAQTEQELTQEYNLLYVAITRAQQSFTYLEGEIQSC